jgi:hypothetical protein
MTDVGWRRGGVIQAAFELVGTQGVVVPAWGNAKILEISSMASGAAPI